MSCNMYVCMYKKKDNYYILVWYNVIEVKKSTAAFKLFQLGGVYDHDYNGI